MTAIWLSIWLLPIAALHAVLGPEHVLVRLGLFFSQVAVVSFGGAYAVLAYVAQAGVEEFAWLTPAEMVDGLAMAETTPGPLIQVTQFVGYLAAWRSPAPLQPLAAAVLGSVVVTWAVFMPSFLWIFVGAPYVEATRAWRPWQRALDGVRAAVVGVMASLAAWFALHTWFGVVDEPRLVLGVLPGEWPLSVRFLVPQPATLSTMALLLTAVGAALLWRRAPVGLVLLVCAAGGMVWVVMGN